MQRKPDGGSVPLPLLGGLVALCCGGPLLLASGALSGVGAWLLDGAWIWLAAVPILFAAGLHMWRRSVGGQRSAAATVATHTGRPNRQK